MIKIGQRRLRRSKTEKLDKKWKSDVSEQLGEERFFRKE